MAARKSNAIYGLYANPDLAQRAVNALEAAGKKLGIKSDAITVLSNEPLEDYPFGRRDSKTPMPWIVAFGALLGGISGYSLASLTQKAYPLVSGGMPIVTKWSDGIITYELTMIGAIITTIITLLWSTRLPNWKKTPVYDPAVSSGKILVGVVNPPPDSRVEVERNLRETGASEVKEFVPS